MYHIVCYGDSNTWGDCPLGGRWPYEVRWPGVLQALLGKEFLVHEEGINGRTTVFDDPMGGTYRNGLKGLGYVLSTHGPIDVLVFMLGTNDTKENLNASPYAIAKGMETLVTLTEHFEYPQQQGVRHILIVSHRGQDHGCPAVSDLWSYRPGKKPSSRPTLPGGRPQPSLRVLRCLDGRRTERGGPVAHDGAGAQGAGRGACPAHP